MASKVLLIIFALFLSSAAYADETDAGQALPALSVLKSLPDSVKNLLGYALSQTGASYRRGGASPDTGFDCSGFVRYVFDHVEGLSLPHSSRAMSLIGSRIRLVDLKPGDLVFFRIVRHRISHVGIYLGNNQFIHAASSRTGSVMISDLTEGYWARRFSVARRVVSTSPESSGITE
ncbi:MAG TPA: C40 family peptidase [Burkholderiales bacterium]|nr:C40 family peptidase [Burkholderiales bacterium]